MAINISEWLRDLGLGQYESAFQDNDVDSEVLLSLTADDLRDLGVASIGHRRRLLNAIAALAAEAAPVSSSPTIEPVSAIQAERRQLTVVFVDLVGSTALSARFDPEDLREIVGAYHRCVSDIIGRFAGFVAKYMGDGVLIYFGYPRAQEDDAERAILAGLVLVEAVASLPQPDGTNLACRVGIATGLVVVGDLLGSGSAQEQAVVGETPNLAARLQALAAPGSVVIGERTCRIVGRLFELEDLGPRSLAGFSEPQRAWRVLGQSGIISRFEALRSSGTPLVGRDEDLDLLLRRWQQAKVGEGRVVLVSGEAGIGKSRLTAALAQRLLDEPHIRIRYFCLPHHQDSALHPFINQLTRAAGFARDDRPERKLARLNDLVSRAAEADDLPLLAELMSLPNSAAALNLSQQLKRQRLFEALLRQLEGLARLRPVLMVFEDAHWIDPTSRELLDLTLDRVRELPVLVIVTSRPEFQHGWAGHPQVTVLALARLTSRDGMTLVGRLAGNCNVPDEVVREIVERTDGVPLFVEELTKAVLETGEGGDRVGTLLAASPQPGIAIPATLHASLMARLDRLGSTAKEIGQIGAVIGREFSYELIELVAQLPPSELRTGLDRLADAELLFRRGVAPQSSYIFKHALVQDAAYSTLLRVRRQEIHARIGKVLEEKFADRAGAQPEILAHHFTQAGLADQAIEYWRRAGIRSIARSANPEAAAQFRYALELLGKLPESTEREERELELTLALAVPQIAVNGFGSERVEQCAFRAKELADRIRESPHQFAAQRLAWNSCLMRQPVPKTVGVARDLLDLAHGSQDPAKLAVAHRALGYSLLMAGEPRKAGDALDRAIELADALSAQDFVLYGEHPSMVCRAYNAQAKMFLGFPETGKKLLDEAIEHARAANNAHDLSWALGVAGHVYQVHREIDATVRFTSEAIDIASKNRFPQWLALAERCKGWAIFQLGELEAGLKLQLEGGTRWYETGAVLHTTHCELILAESFVRTGEYTLARSHLDAAHSHRARYGEEYLCAEIHRLEALLQRATKAPRELVERHLLDALDAARRQSARLLELRAATTFAQILAEQNERQKALDILNPTYAWFTEGFDTADLKNAKKVLDALS